MKQFIFNIFLDVVIKKPKKRLVLKKGSKIMKLLELTPELQSWQKFLRKYPETKYLVAL